MIIAASVNASAVVGRSIRVSQLAGTGQDGGEGGVVGRLANAASR